MVRTVAKAGKKPSETEPAEPREAPTLNMEVCVGANIYKSGEDPPIKADSEYPDWLWELLEPKKTSSELSPDTREYWRRRNKEKAHERNKLKQQLR